MEKYIVFFFWHKTFKYNYKAPHKFSSSNLNFQKIGLKGLGDPYTDSTRHADVDRIA